MVEFDQLGDERPLSGIFLEVSYWHKAAVALPEWPPFLASDSS
jgi:hypothetical protein